MPMNKLLALADRVEKLTGPDRRTDYLIMTATMPAGRGYIWDPEDDQYRYTASLDQAKTLVPQGWGWTVGDKSPDPSLAWCEIDHLPWHEGYGWAVERKLIVQAATPALALTCASLRARAHGGGEG